MEPLATSAAPLPQLGRPAAAAGLLDITGVSRCRRPDLEGELAACRFPVS
jgi:hypothetical protein